jgi:hypothetical protein
MRGTNSTIHKNHSVKDGVGIQSGITSEKEFESDQTMNDSAFNQDSSGQQGFTRQAKGKRTTTSAKEKGNSFEIC